MTIKKQANWGNLTIVRQSSAKLSLWIESQSTIESITVEKNNGEEASRVH